MWYEEIEVVYQNLYYASPTPLYGMHLLHLDPFSAARSPISDRHY